MFNPNYQPIPNISLPTYHFRDRNMSKGDYIYYQTHNPPKNPLSGGEEISLGDLTIPPTLTEIWKREPKKTTQPFPANNWRKIWIRIWLKKFQFDRWQNGIKNNTIQIWKINNERFI